MAIQARPQAGLLLATHLHYVETLFVCGDAFDCVPLRVDADAKVLDVHGENIPQTPLHN